MVRLLTPSLLVAALCGCVLITDEQREDRAGAFDSDGDGFLAGEDCDDDDGAVHPDAEETCNTVDDNCDGTVDEGLTETVWADNDGDGFGNPTAESIECTGTEGFVDNDDDCDDVSAARNPDAAEICDGVDNNCSGTPDDAEGNLWWRDQDNDGFGDPDEEVEGCAAGFDLVANAEDCDDTQGTINPNAVELCDGIDNNCDLLVDNDAVDPTTWYEDLDGDGWGSAISQQACEQPAGWVMDTDDCNDADFTVFPGAPELCDDLDNDCDGPVDEEAPTWWSDADGDGFGDAGGITSSVCIQPDGFAGNNTDCDDGDDTIHPTANEVCNGIDDDCDTFADDTDPEGVFEPPVWYPDTDGDLSGNPAGATIEQCEQPLAHVLDDQDCDDTSDILNPATIWYQDDDGDFFGNDSTAETACDKADTTHSNAELVGGDCDDTDDLAFPDAATACDAISDLNCDGDPDGDVDGDTWADIACGGEDCDDDDMLVFPGTAGCEYRDCREILENEPSSIDGNYDIDPDGFGGSIAPFQVECDMTRNGGGWTRVFFDDFDSGPHADWSHSKTSSCDGETILGGKDQTSSQNSTITLDLLNVPHDKVWIEADAYRIDTWDDEYFWASVDGQRVFWEQYGLLPSGDHFCGISGTNRGDLIIDADWFVPHAANSLLFDLDSDTDTSSNESYGLDDFTVWVGRAVTDENLGNSATNSALSCKHIIDNGDSGGDGAYWIAPRGNPSDAVLTQCDMTTDGGGWTIITNNDNADDEPNGCVPRMGSQASYACGNALFATEDFVLDARGLEADQMIWVAYTGSYNRSSYNSWGWTDGMPMPDSDDWWRATDTDNLTVSGWTEGFFGCDSSSGRIRSIGMRQGFSGDWDNVDVSLFMLSTTFAGSSMAFTDEFGNTGSQSLKGLDDFQDGGGCSDSWSPQSDRGYASYLMVR